VLGTLNELAKRVGGTVVGDGATPIARIAGVDDVDSGTLTFATDERYLAAALQSRAAAVLVDASVSPPPSDKPLLVVENARLALARLLEALRPTRPQGPFVHPVAVIESDAHLAADVYVGAGAYVGRRANVGARSVIGPGAYVGDDVSIGESAWLHAHASVMERCSVGNRVVLHAGSVVGSEGFGWAFVEGRLERIPQVGNVVLDDDVEIGANSCVDRAQTGSTHIGEGTKVDNLVQIGHNCRIGKHCALAALTGLAGSTVVGDYVKIAGQVGTRGHMTIGSRSTVAGQSGVWGDVAEGITVSGNPAREHRDELRREVMIRKLPKLVARVDALERAIEPKRSQ
jgi:UDP-3-O-[3-hydroxymyristoyl] glucosamine N-acyltransferase